MSYQIKELSVGGILDQAIKVTKDGMRTFLPIVFCLLVPLQIGFGLTQLAMMPVLPPDATPEEVFAAQTQLGPELAIVSAVGGLLFYLVQMLTQGALIFAIADLYVGNKPTVGSAFSRGLSRWMPLLGTILLYSLAMMGGFLLFIIPGIFVALWFYLCPSVAVLERQAGTGALKRSKFLMKDNLNKAVAIGFLVMIITIGVSLCAQFIPQRHAVVVATGVLTGFTMIFTTAVGVVFYFSCRCHHENYDLQRLAEAVGADDMSPEVEPSLGL